MRLVGGSGTDTWKPPKTPNDTEYTEKAEKVLTAGLTGIHAQEGTGHFRNRLIRGEFRSLDCCFGDFGVLRCFRCSPFDRPHVAVAGRCRSTDQS